MNERIKQLSEIAYKNHLRNNPESSFGRRADYDKEFAELIVKECARVARATPSPNFHEHLKQQLGHTWDMASVEAGKQIVKHFGVEE